jgi:CheY-like chemotaxis protein
MFYGDAACRARRHLNADTKVSILLVDDLPSNLTVLRAILEPLGHDLVLARSGDEALRQVLRQDFALILLDVQMPDMDGFETAGTMKQRERSRHIPIIFLTASGTEQRLVARGYETGAVDYLAKPIDPEILKCKVRVFVDLYLKTQQARDQAEQLLLHEQREAERQRQILEAELERKHQAEMARLAARQRNFLREVLASVTEGRLRFCDTRDDLPCPLKAVDRPLELAGTDALHSVRRSVLDAAASCSFDDTRAHDLMTAAHEAAMNAVVHAGGGQVRICADDNRIQVWVEDHGAGIPLEQLPRATLERGYSTKNTLGHGFWLILMMLDRVYLLTATTGTTLVLEQDRVAPAAPWLAMGAA